MGLAIAPIAPWASPPSSFMEIPQPYHPHPRLSGTSAVVASSGFALRRAFGFPYRFLAMGLGDGWLRQGETGKGGSVQNFAKFTYCAINIAEFFNRECADGSGEAKGWACFRHKHCRLFPCVRGRAWLRSCPSGLKGFLWHPKRSTCFYYNVQPHFREVAPRNWRANIKANNPPTNSMPPMT